MWTFDEIQRMNPPGPGQKDSILSYILRLNAATPELLCYAADALEKLGPPYICCFAQLPFPIFAESGSYSVKADTETVVSQLEFHFVQATVDNHGQSQLSSSPKQREGNQSPMALATQVLGFIPLWGRRTLYYENYLACLCGEGLRNQVINPALQDGRGFGYKGTVVTSQSFEAELPRKMLDEFPIALRRFLSAYSLLALDDIAVSGPLYGYFLMAAPGRVVYKEPPHPVVRGLLNLRSYARLVERLKIVDALKISHREADGFIHQIQAMNRLARDGEPELAIIGAVSAIEWQINRFVPPPRTRHESSHSLRKALAMPPIKSLPEDLKDSLLEIADIRNALVHGKPPVRAEGRVRTRFHKVDAVLQCALELYRQLNIRKLTAVNPQLE
jgi:hypothetical protein